MPREGEPAAFVEISVRREEALAAIDYIESWAHGECCGSCIRCQRALTVAFVLRGATQRG